MEGKFDLGFELAEKLFMLLLLIDEKRSVDDDFTSWSSVSTSLDDCDDPNTLRLDEEGPAVDFLAVTFDFPIDNSRMNVSTVGIRRSNLKLK